MGNLVAVAIPKNRINNVSLERVLNRDKVHAFESEMKKNVPTVDEAATIAKMKVTHHWSYGIYGRELFLPKDVMIAGEIHKYPNMNIICQGDISIFIDR